MDSVSSILDAERVKPPLDVAALYGRTRPLEVEIGCGKGRFLLARCRSFPESNFLGIERREKRVLIVNRKLEREGLTNARLLRLEAVYVVEELIPPLSVAAYYIFFPDPWPKRRHHRRRLFSPSFMQALHRTLLERGALHLATDFEEYFMLMRSLLRADPRFTETVTFETNEEERSEFELTFRQQGRPIYRASFLKAPAAA
jgi:tRNA (guanine-N7-)-methyltransferase